MDPAKDFQEGDRVRMSQAGLEIFKNDATWSGREGVVVRTPKPGSRYVKVHWQGRQSTRPMHRATIERVQG